MSLPAMVWVLPEPVCPYAKMHTLYPAASMTFRQAACAQGYLHRAADDVDGKADWTDMIISEHM